MSRPPRSRRWLAGAILLALAGCGRCGATPPPCAGPAARPAAPPPQAAELHPEAPATLTYRGTIPRIDVHTHLDPREAPKILGELARQGVVGVVNLSGGPPGAITAMMAEVEKTLDGRMAFCVNVPWQFLVQPRWPEAIQAALGYARAQGARCVKIHKELGLYLALPGEGLLAVDDARLNALWYAAGKLGMPVFIHTGDPKAFWEPVTPANERYAELRLNPGWSFADPEFPKREALLAQLQNVVARYPGTIFVGVHFGNNPEDPAAVGRWFEKYPNFYADTAARLGEIGRMPAAGLRALFIRHADRILFGSDLSAGEGHLTLGAPWEAEPAWADIGPFFALHWRFFETAATAMPHPVPIQGGWTINAVSLPEDVLRKIYYQNASRLLGLDVVRMVAGVAK